jgi:hypothetical protein
MQAGENLRRLIRIARATARDARAFRLRRAEARERRDLVEGHPFLRALLPESDGRHVLIMSMSGDLQQVRLEALLGKALQVHGARVTVLTFRSHRAAVHEFHGLGIRRLVYYEDYAAQRQAIEVEAKALAARCRTLADWKDLQYQGARVGRHALSTVVRARYQPRIDLDAEGVRAELTRYVALGIESYRGASALLKKLRPDCLLTIERGYVSVGAIFDVALERAIPVVQLQASHRDDAFMLKRYNLRNRDVQPRSLSSETWNRLIVDGLTGEREARLFAELEERETSKWFLAKRIKHSDRRRSAHRLRADLRLDSERKVAVLFSHVLWDASMFYYRDLFEDQGEWFAETVRLAAADDSVQWIVKLHPALLWKLRSEGADTEPAELGLIRAAVGELPPHMRLVMPDDDVATADLFEIADAGVTIRGTVGIEAPCLGIPVLTAGTSDYAGRGFTVDAESRQEYMANVRRIKDLERLDEKQVRLARLYAYGIFCERPWRLSSLALDYLPVGRAGDTLEHKFRLNVCTLDELRRAADLGAFARWLLDSDDEDFAEEQPVAAGPAYGVRTAS